MRFTTQELEVLVLALDVAISSGDRRLWNDNKKLQFIYDLVHRELLFRREDKGENV